jgi:O-acetyl-ADP-ribose deacetylase (regulator of RNase III)
MIKDLEGDLLLSSARAIAHGVAPTEHFDSGLALSLRQHWPALAKDFRHWMHTHHAGAGEMWAWPTQDGRWIFNLLIQDPAVSDKAKPGRARIEHVNSSLRELRLAIDREKIESVALPKLATGKGQLPWTEVLPMIQHHLGDLKIPVYLYSTFKAGVAAKE